MRSPSRAPRVATAASATPALLQAACPPPLVPRRRTVFERRPAGSPGSPTLLTDELGPLARCVVARACAAQRQSEAGAGDAAWPTTSLPARRSAAFIERARALQAAHGRRMTRCRTAAARHRAAGARRVAARAAPAGRGARPCSLRHARPDRAMLLVRTRGSRRGVARAVHRPPGRHWRPRAASANA